MKKSQNMPAWLAKQNGFGPAFLHCLFAETGKMQVRA
jgi:hypothetical protein